MILSRIEKNFDRILPLGTVVSWVSAMVVYFSPIPMVFALYNVIIGFIFFVLTVYRDRLSAHSKIVVTISVPIIMGVLSFADGGFASAGMSLLMISNVVAVLFLDKDKSRLVAGSTLVALAGLYIYTRLDSVQLLVPANDAIWAIQLVVYFMYLFILHTVVYSVRDYLLENIEELEDTVDQVYELAYYDMLTGLPNQYQFKIQLSEQVKDNQGGYLAIFNLKTLRLINSIYDDDMGDAVLKRLAEIALSMQSRGEIVARISGNEFALWVPNMTIKRFERRLRAYVHFIKEEFDIPHVNNKIEYYACYAVHEPGSLVDDTFRKARLALMYAKTQNADDLVAYDQDLDNILREDFILKERLELAIDKRDFTVVYQEKVAVFTNEVISVEALARWHDQTLGQVSPMIFIPALEKMNMAVAFGKQVLDQAFHDYEALQEKYHHGVLLSINIAHSHLISDGFVADIRTCLKEHDVPPSSVILEITEDVMIENFNWVKSILQELKALGVKISLDDFGTGYSSLSYLVKLDIDELKIDKSFVDLVSSSQKNVLMLETIIQMAKNLSLNVVVEGVETQEQLEKVSLLGCDEIQGYYFSKPQPLDHPRRTYETTRDISRAR